MKILSRTMYKFLLVVLLLAGCGGGNSMSGIYKTLNDDITLTLKANGSCIADHGGGTIIGGNFRVEGDKVLFQWDNGEADGARIDGEALVVHGLRLMKQ